MALDKMTIRLEGISLDDMTEPVTWKSWRMKKELASFFRYGCITMTQNKIRLEYRRSQKRIGQLLVSFNPGKIVYGEVDSSNEPMDKLSIITLLDEELRGVFKEKDFFRKRMASIMASTSEIYVDIVRPVQEIRDLFEFLKTMKVPGLIRDDSYANRGTIYFHTLTDRGRSNKVFKVYLKGKELRQRGYSINAGLGILRIEVVLRRRKLRADFKRIRKEKKSSTSMKKGASIKNDGETPSYLASVSDDSELFMIASPDYHINTLRSFIEDGCHLDNRITTKETLLQEIGKKFSPKDQNKLVRVVEYLNGECETIGMNPRTVRKWRNILMDMGYHFRYYCRELEPVHFEELFSDQTLMDDIENEMDMMDDEEDNDLELIYEDPYSMGYEMRKPPDCCQSPPGDSAVRM
ncbi:MAG: hypothetical protein WBI17_13570 [Clostridiaceae bacterium]